MAQFPPNVQGAGDPLGYNHYLSWGPAEWDYSFGNQLGGSGYDSRNLGVPYYSDAFGLYPEPTQSIMPTSELGTSINIGFPSGQNLISQVKEGSLPVLAVGGEDFPPEGMGGQASSGTKYQPPGVAPPGQNPSYQMGALFAGEEVLTSGYGPRELKGEPPGFHGGIDVGPLPRTRGYGTSLSAPERIMIIGERFYNPSHGDFFFFVDPRFPAGPIFRAAHTKLLEGLHSGMIIEKGLPIGTLTQTGHITGPHSHIEVIKGPNLQVWNPLTIFKRYY